MALEGRLRDKVHTVVAENIPENAEAERIMQRMINEGAELIYATSYGYLELALKGGGEKSRRNLYALLRQ